MTYLNKEDERDYHRKYRAGHKSKRAGWQKGYRERHKLEWMLKGKQWRNEHTMEVKIYSKLYYQTHKDKILQYDKEYRLSHQEQRLQRKLQLRTEVLAHYGNGKLSCVKCGYSDIRALSMDHINGNGGEHRRDDGINSGNWYRWLLDNKYPVGYQTLCMNCQFIKREEKREYGRRCMANSHKQEDSL